MAVEARHLCLFPPQVLPTRVPIDGMMMEGNSRYGGRGGGRLSGTTTATENNTASLIPPLPPHIYGSPVAAADSIPVKGAVKSDSGLTYSIPVPRKRSRDNSDQQLITPSSLPFPQNIVNGGGCFTFLGQDISLEIQQQQLEIDRFIAQQTAKVRMEMEERRKRYSRRIITAVEETVRNKLRAKEEEIEKIGRLNWALEEKVKSLCVENQIWRELAQSNEATANALRNNLEQVLLAQQQPTTHVTGDHPTAAEEAALLDDAQSCCGSNCSNNDDNNNNSEENGMSGGSNSAPANEIERNKRKKGLGGGRWCKNCGNEEASVLILPCRHLCVCGGCGPSLHSCPVCLCNKNGTLHVNFS